MPDKPDSNQQQNPGDSGIGPIPTDEQSVCRRQPVMLQRRRHPPLSLYMLRDTDAQAPYRNVFEMVRSLATTKTRTDKWNFLPSPVGLYRIDMPKKFAVGLKQNLTVEQLITIGVYTRNQGMLRQAKWLDADAPIYVVANESEFTFTFWPNATLQPFTSTVLDLAETRTGQTPANSRITVRRRVTRRRGSDASARTTGRHK